jgi:hypothetical protein
MRLELSAEGCELRFCELSFELGGVNFTAARAVVDQIDVNSAEERPVG